MKITLTLLSTLGVISCTNKPLKYFYNERVEFNPKIDNYLFYSKDCNNFGRIQGLGIRSFGHNKYWVHLECNTLDQTLLISEEDVISTVAEPISDDSIPIIK